MKQKIGFWNVIQGDTDNIARPKDTTSPPAPGKSLVQVYFPKREMNLSYYNDRFDLQVRGIVYVDGSEDHGFRLDDLSGMKADAAIAQQGNDYLRRTGWSTSA